MHCTQEPSSICSWAIVGMNLAVCIFVDSRHLALDSNLELGLDWHTDDTPPHNDAKHLIIPLLEDLTKQTPTPNWKISVHGG